jgi:hypothetical protein
MPAPKGNKYWEARSSHGRNPIFASPEDLLKSCTEYFNHADDNPIVSYKPYVTRDGAVEQMETIHKRPYTLEGLYVFVGISLDGFRDKVLSRSVRKLGKQYATRSSQGLW